MPTIKLDGHEIPFEKGETIIAAAHKHGTEIPHYCWHPGLSVAANCRMCLVEIERPGGRPVMLDVLAWDADKKAYVPGRKQKLEPACQVECVEGMSIKSESSPTVAEARKHVQEFLLLNHPVDCPICDQAGECKLQDYWLESQRAPKRMNDEIVHKPKGVSFGPTIVYDAERCIVCTRCVRFMDEVAKDPVLDKRERGNLGEIFLAQGRQLEGHYTMMVDHVCPVGALTTKDFRFKARVWFLRKSKSVCTGCATGCNTWLDYDPRTGEVPRLRPRDNLAVNKYWMCDDGILTHRRVQERRVLTGCVGRGKARAQISPKQALEQAAALIKADTDIGVVLSAQRSTEDNYALAYLARAFLGVDKLYVARRNDWQGDDILRSSDANPNMRGALAAAGGSIQPLSALGNDILSGKISTVLALGGPVDVDAVSAGGLPAAKVVVLTDVESALSNEADIILPIASWAEQDGSYVSRSGHEQRFEAGPPPAGESLAGWEVVVRLARALGHTLPFKTFDQLRAAMKPQAAAPAETTAAVAAPAE
ncbi:MAG: 2Fe-2S iron-sulfur cluster-binding protein [Polyangiales bacterium]